jgi:uncharacterized integral membrane protein
MRNLRIALAALFALLLLSFIVQNHDSVIIEYWPFIKRVEAPVWIVMAASAGLGVLAFHFFQAFRKSKKQN